MRKMVELMMVECAHAIDAFELTSSRDLYDIPCSKALIKKEGWSPHQVDAICKRILNPDEFADEFDRENINRWREVNRTKHMKGPALTHRLYGRVLFGVFSMATP